ncbi:MAG TPA: DNA-processing protein DprA [Patescibacteria group bacterium]|nr:DNA-processing protein DprA [Patescibacteria group bacterium]
MTAQEALIALNMISDIGGRRLAALLERFGRPERVFDASEQALMQVPGIGETIAGRIRSFKEESLAQEMRLIKDNRLLIITCQDADYPVCLRQIPDPPLVLYIQGKLLAEDARSIAVVGSRRACLYGLSCSRRFAAELAEAGFTIVSGMARGIDTAAHRGALSSAGRTIAVIGSGFGHIYPDENKALAQEIAGRGAVVSEFPFEAPPLKQNFPRRNRVISGLSLGVLVVEAHRNSGALITADFALEQGREVFAVPGAVDSPGSFGTNRLIKQGAKLVCEVGDIIEEFDDAPEAGPLPLKVPSDLTLEESCIYEIISDKPLTLDEIAERAHLAVPCISVALLQLRIKNLIQELPGKHFLRSAHG